MKWNSQRALQTNTVIQSILHFDFPSQSAVFSLIAGIGSKADNSSIAMAVLSFANIIAQLLMAIKDTRTHSSDWNARRAWMGCFNLFAINYIRTALAYILFPYIWRS